MTDLFASGRVADLILIVMALEAAALVVWLRATGRGGTIVALAPNLAAGACLVLALRGALVAAPWPMIAAALIGALVSHLIDIYRRLRAP